jgi:hypothetical protein
LKFCPKLLTVSSPHQQQYAHSAREQCDVPDAKERGSDPALEEALAKIVGVAAYANLATERAGLVSPVAPLSLLTVMDSASLTSAQVVTAKKSSAVKAGWICLILGYLTFWIFGFGFVFFSVTIILAIVAMCTDQVVQGVVLLISSLASIAICAVIFMVVILGTFGLALQKAQEKQTKVRQHIMASPTPRP